MPGSTNKRDIALLDVDNTVLFGAAPNTTYNDNLLNALLEAGVRDIYLFTSMTINEEGVMERQTLANYMESKGFKVHGVITPSDIFWHLDQELMEGFLSHFKRPDNSLTKTLLEQDQYSAINFAIESQPGVAFALALNNPESMARITAHSQAANSVLGLVKKANDEYLTEKGHMYALFIKHKPEWVNRIIFVDDANDNISAVEKANEKYKCRLFAVLNRDKQNACELPASFYQESFASLIGNHRLRQLLASYCDAKQNNSRQSSSFS
ncbi:hypothetical protein [Legionella feeleii]|uniref:Uncharacterized protein n=1 Tax=Legionella feeleii TaxID=453 RepID=A0A378ISH7_9GAMM|nr:hypothetical protein [Legionella feeleii]STX37461.1 Uncharacterised protein [Legionella feeleii]